MFLAYRLADEHQCDYLLVPGRPTREGQVGPYCVPAEHADGYERENGVLVRWRHAQERPGVRDVLAAVMGHLHRAGKCPEDPVPHLQAAYRALGEEIERRAQGR